VLALPPQAPRIVDDCGIWDVGAAEGLSRARLLEFPGLGHGVVPASGCAQGIMVDFLDRPEGGYDTACLDQVTVPEFSTGP
jgi:hypothetical protein